MHARGSAAHGFFECYDARTELTRVSLFAEAGKRTLAFVRFSTVVGERGSPDTPRDVRGFAVKFYTDEGNGICSRPPASRARCSGEPDPGLFLEAKAGAEKVLPQFVKAIARHRHHEREMDPPAV